MRKGKVFNSLKRPRLLRKHIPGGELGAAALVLGAIAAGTLWLGAQRDNYDPAERDVSVETLEKGAVRDTLYRTPLKRWRDPAIAVGDAAAPADLGPLPATLLSGGWRTMGRPQTFTRDSLYEKINGQAEQYLKFGFQQLQVIALEHPASKLTLDIFLYDQGTLPQALGLYAEQRAGRPVVSAGPVHHTPNPLGTGGLAGRYLFQVIGSAEGQPVAEKTQEIVAALATLASEAGSTPAAFAVLTEGLGVPFAGIGFTPINVFQLGFAERFWFGSPAPKKDLRFYVHEAESPAAATALASKLAEGQAEEYEPLATEDGVRLFRHRFLKTWFALASTAQWVFGLEGAPDRTTAAEQTARLRAALSRPSPDGDPPDE